jgi:hypothetical protein
MTFGRKQRERSISTRNEQFYPSLPLPKVLIGGYLKSDLLGVKLQRNILVAYRNTDNFDPANHVVSSKKNSIAP